jgi:hypothetical protein
LYLREQRLGLPASGEAGSTVMTVWKNFDAPAKSPFVIAIRPSASTGLPQVLSASALAGKR